MLKRWIIRGISIALLTLCVTVWVGSYFGYVRVYYGGDTNYWWLLPLRGELLLTEKSRNLGGQIGWDLTSGQYGATTLIAEAETLYEGTQYHLLGFGWHPRTAPEPWQYVMIPLWFTTILSAGFLWFVWRKTRPKFSGKGFPVDVGDKQTKA